MAEVAQFAKPEFELAGGTLCLDFANTSNDHKALETGGEEIHSYADLLAFGVQTGDLSIPDARKLLNAANHSRAKADTVLRKAHQLREAVYRIFSAVAAERKPSREDLEMLNRFMSDTLGHARVVAKPEGYVRAWEDSESLERPMWPIVESAVELLTSSKLGQTRECGAETCSWLFVDTSRNRSRRWCDMKVCGNRAKARRHYERVRG
jgi:predicted RNA-binding Zn ribbon-like protein